ncbi:MAG: cell wall hydrolase [Geminicoccaceae bacterium]
MMHHSLVGAAIGALCLLATLPVTAQEASAEAQELFALNLYHEARSEGEEGMRLIGHVVLNRVASDEFPNEVAAVITQERGNSCEFRWYCDGRSDTPDQDPELYALAEQITSEMLDGDAGDDPTNGALWFHEDFRDTPAFLRDRERTAHIGTHYFYK